MRHSTAREGDRECIEYGVSGIAKCFLPWYYQRMAKKRREKSSSISLSSRETVSEYTKAQDISQNPSFLNKKTILIGVVILLLALGFYKKEWFVAATVNGSPITTIELMSRMSRDYKAQALDQVISEKIILAEAKNKDVQVNKQEIDGKISEIEGQFGGAAGLESVLSQQGQTRESLGEQIKIQLTLEKLYSNEATVSSQEVDNFIKESASLLQSTDSAKQKEEAENVLKQQKLSQIFSQKFQELKQKAKIQIF